MQELIFPAVGRWVGAQREWEDLVAEMRHELPERLCTDLVLRAQQRAQQTTRAFASSSAASTSSSTTNGEAAPGAGQRAGRSPSWPARRPTAG